MVSVSHVKVVHHIFLEHAQLVRMAKGDREWIQMMKMKMQKVWHCWTDRRKQAINAGQQVKPTKAAKAEWEEAKRLENNER